jgi:hypothetical protein
LVVRHADEVPFTQVTQAASALHAESWVPQLASRQGRQGSMVPDVDPLVPVVPPTPEAPLVPVAPVVDPLAPVAPVVEPLAPVAPVVDPLAPVAPAEPVPAPEVPLVPDVPVLEDPLLPTFPSNTPPSDGPPVVLTLHAGIADIPATTRTAETTETLLAATNLFTESSLGDERRRHHPHLKDIALRVPASARTAHDSEKRIVIAFCRPPEASPLVRGAGEIDDHWSSPALAPSLLLRRSYLTALAPSFLPHRSWPA